MTGLSVSSPPPLGRRRPLSREGAKSAAPRARAWRAACATACGLVLGGCQLASACSTPVFQYALENWPPDLYDLVLSHRSPLAAGTAAAAEALLRDGPGGPVNAGLRVREDPDLPEGETRLTVRFPGRPSGMPPLWTGAWSPDRLRAVLDSPLRNRLAAELLQGASVVFLFLGAGEAEADAAARTRLQAGLDDLARTLELPPPDETAPVAPPTAAGTPALRFPILDVPRDDPAEEFLRAVLRASEPDLAETREPMAFPVFGRGRLLYAIVGGGINRDVLLETCGFLTGACSCQVKSQNPGIDLLLRAEWDQALKGRPATLEELPPLTGLGAVAVPATAASTAGPSQTPAARTAAPARIVRRTLWVAGAALLAVLAGTLAVLRAGRRSHPR